MKLSSTVFFLSGLALVSAAVIPDPYARARRLDPDDDEEEQDLNEEICMTESCKKDWPNGDNPNREAFGDGNEDEDEDDKVLEILPFPRLPNQKKGKDDLVSIPTDPEEEQVEILPFPRLPNQKKGKDDVHSLPIDPDDDDDDDDDDEVHTQGQA